MQILLGCAKPAHSNAQTATVLNIVLAVIKDTICSNINVFQIFPYVLTMDIILSGESACRVKCLASYATYLQQTVFHA